MMVDAKLVALLRAPELSLDVRNCTAVLDAHGDELTPAGVEAVRRAAPEAWRPYLPTLLDLIQGTKRATRLGKGSDDWLFTTISAQQATHPVIATHHAAPFVGTSHVVEVCTGAGLDTLALARVCTHVTTFEADPITAAVAAGNLRRRGIGNVDVVAEHVPGPSYHDALSTATGLWADPSRRDEAGRRARRASTYDPPLGLFTTASPRLAIVGIKIGPGDAIDPDAVSRFTSEYVGWRQECRERVLWRGVPRPLVSLVDIGHAWTPGTVAGTPSITVPAAGLTLVEPHAAVIASGGVNAYFASISANVIDTRIAYGLCITEPATSPLHRSFGIVAVERGIDVKHMQRMIRTLGWGPGTEIKKRGVDIDPMSRHRALEFVDGGPSGVILLTRGSDERWTIYAERRSLLA